MRAAIFNPYLDTLGGGERYTFSFVKVLIKKGYQVDVEWKVSDILKQARARFGIEIKQARVIKGIKRGEGYDLCFWVSDGSIPALKSRKNIIHFQFPFKDVNGKSLLNKMKLYRINYFICNSLFTKRFIDKEFGIKSIVIYPPVDVKKIKSKRKENIILYVGRFSQLTQKKRQDVLIKAFKKLFDMGASDWRLVLAGGTEVGVDKYLDELFELSKNYPIELVKSPTFVQLRKLYGKAKIFWSASGYGVDGNKNPKKVEHFGITLVEAMAAGCVPLVYKAGGHIEIIDSEENGYLWKKTNEMIKETSTLIDRPKKLRVLSKSAKEKALKFSYENFEKEIIKIIS